MGDHQMSGGCPCGRKPQLEPMEPRILLDGDGTAAAAGGDGDCPAALAEFYGNAPSQPVAVDCVNATAGAESDVTAQTDTTNWLTVGLPSRVNRSGATFVEAANSPIGYDTAIFPGRVVWVHDPAATRNGLWVSNSNAAGPFWWDNAYTDQYVVDTMMAKGLMKLTGTTSVAAAWTARGTR